MKSVATRCRYQVHKGPLALPLAAFELSKAKRKKLPGRPLAGLNQPDIAKRTGLSLSRSGAPRAGVAIFAVIEAAGVEFTKRQAARRPDEVKRRPSVPRPRVLEPLRQ
jgi:hypothetical protein